MRRRLQAWGLGVLGVMLAGCHTDMWVQPKYRTLQEADSTMFRNGMSARSLPAGVVARGFERADTEYYTARDASGKLILKIPMAKVMRELKLNEPRDVLMRGQEMFDAFCSPCHGRIGDGKGMIALRGLDLKRTPANYHTKKLRDMPDGHFYDVITNGFGVMYPYGPRIVPEDRWAIVSYIRALQKSQMPGGGR